MIEVAAAEMISTFFPGVKSLSFLRLDRPDPVAGGNKSFKLKYHLELFRMMGEGSILSFGGAYSNHIAALAYAGKVNSFPTIGVIRGEELNENSNEVLRFAKECGMKLHFVSRQYYRQKYETDSTIDFIEQFGAIYIVPEGGGGDQGVRGCLEILSPQCDVFDEIILPVGTGTTIAGIIQTAKAHQRVNGIAVVADQSLAEKIQRMMYESISCEWNLLHDFTLGGYANTSDGLKEFIAEMKSRFGLPLDPVYSGKALFALHRMATSGSFKAKNVLFVHTGGYAFMPSS
jgi:1-aminocyclopropane-1-carboxylate deaminase